MPLKRIYHGWIVIHREEGFNPRFFAERVVDGKRTRPISSYSPAEIVDWWDKECGCHISLEELPIGYRVYTTTEVNNAS